MNNYRIKLKIGEFSKLCFVTVKTLRHYEKLGLLLPHDVDEWTGYRYYDVNQMKELNDILNLKKLGFSLESIKEMKNAGIRSLTPEMTDKALEEAKSELCKLRQRIADLEQIKGFATKGNHMDNITIKPLPSATVASFRKHLKSYDELGPLCVNVIGPEMERLGCVCPKETEYCFTIDYNKNYNPDDIDLEFCEVVSEYHGSSDILKFRDLSVVETAVCYSHYGSYEDFPKSMSEIMKYIEENHYKITESPRFSYIHGVWDSDSVADWLTEIQIPVKKT